MSRISKALKLWLPFVIVGSALVVLAYTSVQQAYRQGANDPQIQMAEDAAAALKAGATPHSVLPAQSIDMRASLAPFLIVTDQTGLVVASSTTLDGTVPIPPQGALDYAKSQAGSVKGDGQNRITWEPKDGVRIAAVIMYHGGDNPGYVIAGRSLREVEKRENDLTTMAGLDFLGLLAGVFLVLLVTV